MAALLLTRRATLLLLDLRVLSLLHLITLLHTRPRLLYSRPWLLRRSPTLGGPVGYQAGLKEEHRLTNITGVHSGWVSYCYMIS